MKCDAVHGARGHISQSQPNNELAKAQEASMMQHCGVCYRGQRTPASTLPFPSLTLTQSLTPLHKHTHTSSCSTQSFKSIDDPSPFFSPTHACMIHVTCMHARTTLHALTYTNIHSSMHSLFLCNKCVCVP